MTERWRRGPHPRPAGQPPRQTGHPPRPAERPAHPAGHDDTPRRRGTPGESRPWIAFLRANPQVLILLIVCLVLGIGTFVAVLVSLVTAGSDQPTGEPSGAIFGAHVVLASTRWLIL